MGWEVAFQFLLKFIEFLKSLRAGSGAKDFGSLQRDLELAVRVGIEMKFSRNERQLHYDSVSDSENGSHLDAGRGVEALLAAGIISPVELGVSEEQDVFDTDLF